MGTGKGGKVEEHERGMGLRIQATMYKIDKQQIMSYSTENYSYDFV